MRWTRLWLVGVVGIEIWGCSGSSIGPFVGTVSGTVTNSMGGGISAATVVVTPNGGAAQPAVQTTAGGTYSVTSVPAGAGSVALSNLPANCTAPSPTSYSGLTGSHAVTVNVTVTCTAVSPFGAVSGSVVSSLGGVIAGATVTVTPAGGSALPAAQTSAVGDYTVNPVPDGSGSVAISALPPNCTAPSTASYSGLAASAIATVNFTASCTAPVGPFGTVTGTVTGSTGGKAGFAVTVTPAGDSAFVAVVTDTSGAFTISGVPVGGNGGSGSVVARGGTGGVVCAGAAVYNGLAGAATVTVNIKVGCIPIDP